MKLVLENFDRLTDDTINICLRFMILPEEQSLPAFDRFLYWMEKDLVICNFKKEWLHLPDEQKKQARLQILEKYKVY